MRTALATVLLLATSLVAQDNAAAPRFRIALAASVGTIDFSADATLGEDDTGAGLFRL